MMNGALQEAKLRGMTTDEYGDGIAASATGENSIDTSCSDGNDGMADPFALYLKGKILLGRTRPACAEPRLLADAGALEQRAASLMLRGRELESVAVNEELVRRFDGVPEAAHVVARARFNAGCAYARIGIVEKANEQFAAAAMEVGPMNEYHRTLSLLVDEGIRQTREMSRQILAHHQRAQERRRALGWK